MRIIVTDGECLTIQQNGQMVSLDNVEAMHVLDRIAMRLGISYAPVDEDEYCEPETDKGDDLEDK